MSTNNEEGNKIPEPFYHQSEEYITAYFGNIPEEIAANKSTGNEKNLMSTIISLTTDSRNSQKKHAVLTLLRERDAREILVKMLGMPEYQKHYKNLLCTCWETGLDFSPYLAFFVDFLQHKNPEISLEAATVIEEMAGGFSAEDLEYGIEVLGKVTSDHPLHTLILSVKERLQNTSVN
jgi:hypothetical protein